jgi:hypothetical protein
MVVIQVVFAMRQGPRNEGGEADGRMRNLTNNAVDPLLILSDSAVAGVVSNAPHAPDMQTNRSLVSKRANTYIAELPTSTVTKLNPNSKAYQ